MGLEAGIWALRLGFGPRDWDLGLEAGIWALRLGGGMEKKEEEEEGKKKEKEKIRHMCESIGHRPLRGRCPKSEFEYNGQLMMKRRFFLSTFGEEGGEGSVVEVGREKIR